MTKRTLILGASPDSSRYANLAANMLSKHAHPIINIGIKKGEAAGQAIEPMAAPYADVDTITLYVGPQNQPVYYDYILATKPQRVIFNPGTENPELEELLDNAGIAHTQACTLVLLSTGQY